MTTEQARPPAPPDQITDGLATRLAGNDAFTSQFLPWRANTAYTAGTFVSNGGNLYTVNSDFTTGASFSTTGLTQFTAGGSASAFWIPATAFASKTGAPSLAGFELPYWSMGDAATHAVRAALVIPSSVTTFSVVARFTDPGAGTGNAVLYCETARQSVGQSYATFAAVAQSDVTQSFPNTLWQDVTLGASITRTDDVMSLTVARKGADAADTKTGSVAFLGVKITPLS